MTRAELLASSSAIVLASLEARPSLEARAALAGQVLGAQARALRDGELLRDAARRAERGEAAL